MGLLSVWMILVFGKDLAILTVLSEDSPSTIIKKDIFQKAGGFDYKYWPGEDTVLCLNITKRLSKNILYHPSLVVYHHRRAALLPHLQQLKRYSIQRGHFVKKFPQTSFRLGYFLPSFFVVYLTLLPLLYFLLDNLSIIPLIPLYLYISMLIITFTTFLTKGNSLISSLLALLTIPATHIFYGVLFLYGLSKKNNSFNPHQINIDTGEYVGG
jgi:GT2 family glycosyltransferase